MRHKILTRMFVMSLAIMMMFTSIPINMIALAGGSGGGLENSGGLAVNVDDDALNDENIGLRFSLVTLKDEKTQVVKNKWDTYYLDVWADGHVPGYNQVNSTGRYSPLPTRDNITKTSASSFDKLLNEHFIKAGGEFRKDSSGNSELINLHDLLKPGKSNYYIFTESNGFAVNGGEFFNWFMYKAGSVKGEEYSRYAIAMSCLYQGKSKGLDADKTFLVVEPIVYLCNPVDPYNINSGYETRGNRYVASWYGYLEYNVNTVGRDPGQTPTVRNRLAKLGNGSLLTKTADTTPDMITNMWNVLGVNIPDKLYNSAGLSFYWFGNWPGYGNNKPYNNMHQQSGLGMQAYWLKGQLDDKDPIDSYDIVTNPTNPDPCEEPKATDEYDNTGDKTIIKTYIDLYRDSESGDYTQVINKKTYTRKQCSSDVVISDESGVNGGYKVEAWYTSKSDSDGSKVKGSDMLHTKNKVVADSTDENIGKKQFSINGYKEAKSAKANGSQRFSAIESQTKGCFNTTDGAKRYTREKPLPERIKSEDQQYITLKGDEKTLVILYVREHGYIESTTGKDGGGGDITTEFDPYKQLKIVKCYGIVNPVTYEVEDEKGTVVWEQKTRNVHITPEDGYRLAEYVYSTRGSSDWNSMTASKWGTVQGTDKDKDKQFYIKGFIDGEKRTILYYKKRKG